MDSVSFRHHAQAEAMEGVVQSVESGTHPATYVVRPGPVTVAAVDAGCLRADTCLLAKDGARFLGRGTRVLWRVGAAAGAGVWLPGTVTAVDLCDDSYDDSYAVTGYVVQLEDVAVGPQAFETPRPEAEWNLPGAPSVGALPTKVVGFRYSMRHAEVSGTVVATDTGTYPHTYTVCPTERQSVAGSELLGRSADRTRLQLHDRVLWRLQTRGGGDEDSAGTWVPGRITAVGPLYKLPPMAGHPSVLGPLYAVQLDDISVGPHALVDPRPWG